MAAPGLIGSAEAIGEEVRGQQEMSISIQRGARAGASEIAKVVGRCQGLVEAAGDCSRLSGDIESSAAQLAQITRDLDLATDRFLERLRSTNL